MMDWTNEKVLRLVAEYEARPMLWNPKDWNYKNKIKKMKAWEEIANIFNISRLEVERKFKILLVQYRRERSKIMKMVEAGHDLAELEAIAWYAYRSFNFFHLRSRNSHVAYPLNMNSSNNLNETEYEEIKIENTSDDYDVESNDNYIEDFLESTIEELPETKKIKPRIDHSSVGIIPKLTTSDDIDIFASYIASEMKNLNHPQTKRKLKRNILKALLEACEEDEAMQVQL